MPEVFKNPNEQAKSITSNDQMYREQLKKLGIRPAEMDSYLQSIAQSEKEGAERERNKTAQNAWKEANEKKPHASTPEQLEKIRNAAFKQFGRARNYKDAFYMYPNGTMISGSGGQGYGRYFDHRDINGVYSDLGIDLYESDQGGNSTNMLDFMRGGNIRMIPETDGIDLMQKPTSEQMNAIYDMFKRGYLNSIQVSNPNDKYGQQLGYLEDIENERQISDFMRKYFK